MGLRRDRDQVLTIVDAQMPAKAEQAQAEQAQGAAADSVAPAEVVVAQEEAPVNGGESSVWRQWLSIFKSPDE